MHSKNIHTNTSTNYHRLLALSSLLLFGTTTTIVAFSFSLPKHQIECQANNSGSLQGQALISELNKRLKTIRDKLHKLGKPTPELLVANHPDFTEITFELDKNCNVSSLISKWNLILLKPGNESSPLYRMARGTVEVLSSDRKTKLSWREDKFGHVVSIKKHHGFTPTEIDALVNGYDDVMSSFTPTATGSSKKNNIDNNDDGGFAFSFQQHHPESFDDFFPRDLRDIFAQFGRARDFIDWENFDESNDRASSSSDFYTDERNNNQGIYKGSSSSSGTSRPPSSGGHFATSPSYSAPAETPVSSGTSPVSKLQAMGLVVYDPTGKFSSNDRADPSQPTKLQPPPVMSWDALAGYEDVKQQIEDTVINSFKYGETYDAIIRKTRVDFESNRPKAILLEGPPGTG